MEVDGIHRVKIQATTAYATATPAGARRKPQKGMQVSHSQNVGRESVNHALQAKHPVDDTTQNIYFQLFPLKLWPTESH